VFIIHGTADTLIKSSYSEDLYASANEPRELWLIPGAKHNDIAEKGGDAYTRRILEFFQRHLQE
jgi:uncharacterized protein